MWRYFSLLRPFLFFSVRSEEAIFEMKRFVGRRVLGPTRVRRAGQEGQVDGCLCKKRCCSSHSRGVFSLVEGNAALPAAVHDTGKCP